MYRFPALTTRSLLALAVMLFAAFSSEAQRNAIYTFDGIFTDGNNVPDSAPIADPSGNLYGTLGKNPNRFGGGVYQLTPAGNGTWSESFYAMTGGSMGAYPMGGLLRDASGNLYGTASAGGSGNCGLVFELTPPSIGNGQWTENVLYNFGCGADGGTPYSSLISDAQGNLYGTTVYGGNGVGVVFMLTPPSQPGGAWTEQVLYSFLGGAYGANPFSGLVIDRKGNLYGTTSVNETGRIWGTVFQLRKTKNGTWEQTVLHKFNPGGADGLDPAASLTMDSSGALYGTTRFGGNGCPSRFRLGCGIVFQLVPPATGSGTWTENILYEFTAMLDGGESTSSVVMDSAGGLYGTTTIGGQNDGGTLFKLTPPASGSGPWSITPFSFAKNSGGSPGVLLEGNNIFVPTYIGGTNQGGVVYHLVQ